MLNASEKFIVLEKCSVMFTGQTHLSKGNFPFNLNVLSALFNYRFEINMATWTMLLKIF